MAVFFSVVSKMVSNIDIFQGIVSKLVIPVSWQHYTVVAYFEAAKFSIKRFSFIYFIAYVVRQRVNGMNMK